MQLTRLRCVAVANLIVVLTAGSAGADGEVTLRGAYYKERATRVSQPMIDATFEAGESGKLDAHFLIDAITSASGAAGATGQAFTENRLELGIGYQHTIDKLTLGAAARFSEEPDYTSMFATARAQVSLADQNTTLSTFIGTGDDDITNASSQGAPMSPLAEQLTTRLAGVSVSQVLSPIVVASLSTDLTYLNGYQANPYRLVAAGGVLVPERVPRKRYRTAVAASVRGFMPATKSTLFAGYRFYVDDWGIIGHTPELRAVQELTPSLNVHVRYRLHRQRSADFYKAVYDSSDMTMEPFLTSDEKLGPMTTHTIGLKVDVGLRLLGLGATFDDMRAEALVEYLAQNTTFGNAVAAQLALTLPFEY